MLGSWTPQCRSYRVTQAASIICVLQRSWLMASVYIYVNTRHPGKYLEPMHHPDMKQQLYFQSSCTVANRSDLLFLHMEISQTSPGSDAQLGLLKTSGRMECQQLLTLPVLCLTHIKVRVLGLLILSHSWMPWHHSGLHNTLARPATCWTHFIRSDCKWYSTNMARLIAKGSTSTLVCLSTSVYACLSKWRCLASADGSDNHWMSESVPATLMCWCLCAVLSCNPRCIDTFRKMYRFMHKVVCELSQQTQANVEKRCASKLLVET